MHANTSTEDLYKRLEEIQEELGDLHEEENSIARLIDSRNINPKNYSIYEKKNKIIDVVDYLKRENPNKEIVKTPNQLFELTKDYQVILKRKYDGKIFKQEFGFQSYEQPYFVEAIS